MSKLAAFCSLLLVVLLLTPGRSQDKTPVRPLTVKPDPDKLPGGGAPGVKLYTSSEMAAKQLGTFVARQLAAQVDFAKEQVVHVQWFSGGPPFGTLRHELKGTGVNFFVQGPPPGKARGEAARIGSDFFAIPVGTKATFEPKER